MSQLLSLGAINKHEYLDLDQEDKTTGDEELARQLQIQYNAEDNHNLTSSSASSNKQIIDIYELSFEKGKVMQFLETKYSKALMECAPIIDAIKKCRGDNVDLVAELATTIKSKLPNTIKNRVSFCFYGATWKAMIGSRETAQFLFGPGWGGHWGWWIRTAIERQKIGTWLSIIKEMKDFGLDIEKFPAWPSNNTILFENTVLRLKVIGTTCYCVEYL
jgi:hypothetical protein